MNINNKMIRNFIMVWGIKCWGVYIGIKLMWCDLVFIYLEVFVSVVCIFIQNEVVAELVKFFWEYIKSGKVQFIVCNVGNVNVCIGEQGCLVVEVMVQLVVEELGIEKELVIVVFIGLIGEFFLIEDVVLGICENMVKFFNDVKVGFFVANVILIIDIFVKEGFMDFDLNGIIINIVGIFKGLGMIYFNMVIMFGFIVCDLAIEFKLLNKVVKECVDLFFNMIMVDGDIFINDMVVVFCNGMAGNEMIKLEKDEGYQLFCN